MGALADPFRNPTAVIPKVRTSVITGGAAGNHTLTGIDLELDRLISVHAIAAAQVTGFAAGAYTMDADDATANSATIPTGLTAPDTVIVQVVDSGNNDVTSDADITVSGANIVVADGSTFNVTDGYVVRWVAYDASDAAATVSGSDLTSEFSITADDTINNAGGTATAGDVLVVVWYDHDWGDETNAAWNS